LRWRMPRPESRREYNSGNLRHTVKQ
jgi:hypothetical protein